MFEIRNMTRFEEQLKEAVKESELGTLYAIEEELLGKRSNKLGIQLKQWAAKINKVLDVIGCEVTISKKIENNFEKKS